MVKCPKCGNEIEIAEVVDYENDPRAFPYVTDHPYMADCIRITPCCETCRKSLWVNIQKGAFPEKDLNALQELAKELFAEKMKESEEDNGTDTQE